MKILVLNWQDRTNPFAGGAETHVHEIFSRLAARGHSVTLYCSHFPNAPREEMLDGLRVIREGHRNTFNAFVPWRYLRRFQHEEYDVVVDDVNKIPFYTPLFVRKPLLALAHHLFGKSIFAEAGVLAGLYVYGSEWL
ncbi:MAG: glycosyltransferase family 4 protein, partial [Anaerolineae bacterium]|nr:glycosyltransferase family 4 protein [Anaerolineae bacterium]